MGLVIFCESDRDMSMYLMLMTKVVTVISTREALAMIKPVPANCPADVRFVNEIRIATHTGIPPFTAIIPKVKETGIYPRAIGIPSLNPLTN